MKKKSKVAIASAILGSATSAIGSFILYRNFIRRNPKPSLKPEVQELVDQISQTHPEELIGFTSFDGLQLKAHYFAGNHDCHIYALLVHGYHEQAYAMMPYAAHFMAQGYHVLMPDLRGHGASEGDYVGFGYHDHYDIQGYIDLLRERDPEAKIFLFGVSMGAATVMMAAGDFLPDNVKCVIEDCGYTSAWQQCCYNMHTIYHLPAFPFLTLTNWVLKLRHHYSLKEAAPIRSVAKAVVPMLFIHGDQDAFVPFSMLDPLYEACSSAEKEKLVMPGAVHATSYQTDAKLYWNTVDAFLQRYL